MAYKFTNDYNEAQDLSQEIFLKIYKEIGSFRFESKLSTWIYRVSMNTCLDWKRKNSKIKNLSTNIVNHEDEIVEIELKDESSLPEDIYIQSESQREIHQLVLGLPDIYKTVIIMYHFNNMSYEEISKTLSLSERTVETRLYRARRLLKEEFTKLKDRSGYKWNATKL